jgi:hypothetical protein
VLSIITQSTAPIRSSLIISSAESNALAVPSSAASRIDGVPESPPITLPSTSSIELIVLGIPPQPVRRSNMKTNTDARVNTGFFICYQKNCLNPVFPENPYYFVFLLLRFSSRF